MPTRTWDTTNLGALSHVEMGQSPPSEFVSESEGAGVPFLQGNAEFSGLHPIPRLWCRKPSKMCKAGDALISVRAPVGAINRADRDYCVGRGLAAIRFTGADPDFGFHALGYFSTALRRVAQGSTFEAVGGADLRSLSFPHCSRIEQRSIAVILDTLDEAIRRTERIIVKLQQMRQGLLHDLLTRGVDEKGELRPSITAAPHLYKQSPLGLTPKVWEVRPFGLLDCSTTLGTGKRGASGRDNDLFLLKMGNMEWGGLRLAEIERVARSRVPGWPQLLLREGDLLFNTRNTPELVGKTAAWRGALPDTIPDNNILRVRFGPEASGVFVSHYMGNAGRRSIGQLSTGTTSVAAVYWRNLRHLLVPLPPRVEQDAIVARIDDQDAGVDGETRVLAKFRLLKHGLLQDLLTGRVRVPLPAGMSA